MKEITSINNSFVKELLKLKDKKERKLKNQFIIEGEHLVEEASKTNKLLMVLSSNKELLVKYQNIDSYLVTYDIIKKLSTTENPQKIIGVSNGVHYESLNNFNKVVLLDNVQDPGNMGTIIRTSASLGYDTIMITNDSCDIYNEKVIRSTQGTIYKINIVINSLDKLISNIQSNNVPILSTSLKANTLLEDIKQNNKYCVAFGNEAHGIRKELEENANQLFKIEMKNDVESLNVSVAAGIILYNLMKDNK